MLSTLVHSLTHFCSLHKKERYSKSAKDRAPNAIDKLCHTEIYVINIRAVLKMDIISTYIYLTTDHNTK